MPLSMKQKLKHSILLFNTLIHGRSILIQYVKAALTSIQQHCIRESRTLLNLLPAASELTNEHFKAW